VRVADLAHLDTVMNKDAGCTAERLDRVLRALTRNFHKSYSINNQGGWRLLALLNFALLQRAPRIQLTSLHQTNLRRLFRSRLKHALVTMRTMDIPYFTYFDERRVEAKKHLYETFRV